MNKKFFAIFFLMIALLVGCSSKEEKTATETPKDEETPGESTGGVINTAITSSPATLDPHMNTAAVTSEVSRNIYEQLFALNATYEPVPMLAESYALSEDGTTYTIHLRKGVKFHNGDEMVAEDVVASLKKWIEVNSKKALFDGAEFKIEDNYTIVMQLPKVMFGVIEALADNGQLSGIMPKEIAESATAMGATEFIGTGPFKLKEWKQDQYIKLEKFQDYQSLDTPADGVSGKKEVFVDELVYYIVPDESIRVAGLTTGEYDAAMMLPIDSYDQLKASNPDLEVKKDVKTLFAVLNKKDGIFADQNMRHAVNAIFDKESILIGVQSTPEFYKMDSSYMPAEQERWYSEAGNEYYDINDVEKARGYLGEAGYNGEEIRILTTRDYDILYNSAIIAKEQLEKAGVKVNLIVTDWPTLLETRKKPGEWDMFFTGFPTVLTPTQNLFMSKDWPGWTDDPKLTEYIEKINSSKSAEEAQEIWQEAQGYAWEYMPASKIGTYYEYAMYNSKTIEGYDVQFQGNVFWNTKKK
ncbi:ABC transporter substrate-binding protein [Cytobacillus depressus]|uniref:ABC transporter substrate-binding protein n=1 Tax=Cytobacillus depressus TaxID=1602942 RepID=A0A6L3V3I5_9BACI|nr:ABC transporter substrate-binding protein [Cytobacillus depressus]KAB2328318.1 ABC transporter substrate-binding protein [Cytobacillus depressus]